MAWFIALLTTLFMLYMLSSMVFEGVGTSLPQRLSEGWRAALAFLAAGLIPLLATLAYLRWGDAVLYWITTVSGVVTLMAWIAAIRALRHSQPGDGCLITLRFLGAVLLGPLAGLMLYAGLSGLNSFG